MALEKKIENKVCEYARENGFLTPKLNVVGERGWPDRLWIDPDGYHVYVEFKAPGKKPDPIQLFRQEALAVRGLLVLVIDNVELGKEYVDDLVAARLPEESDDNASESGISGIIS